MNISLNFMQERRGFFLLLLLIISNKPEIIILEDQHTALIKGNSLTFFTPNILVACYKSSRMIGLFLLKKELKTVIKRPRKEVKTTVVSQLVSPGSPGLMLSEGLCDSPLKLTRSNFN